MSGTDKLSASWVLVVGALGIGYYYWRMRKNMPASPGIAVSRPADTGGGPPVLPQIGGLGPPTAPPGKGDSFPWPEAARKALERVGGPSTHPAHDPATDAWIRRGALPLDPLVLLGMEPHING